jgi:ADP-ribose pyrophosphatase
LALDYYAEDEKRIRALADKYDDDYSEMDAEIRDDILSAKVYLEPEMVDVYLAEDLVPGEQHLDDAEDIRVEAFELDTLLDMIYKGVIHDAKTVAAILAYRCRISQ